MAAATPEEELHLLEVKLKQLKLDYEQYFNGSRPREPSQTRSEIQKALLQWQIAPIKNTALRFKFNTINSRFQSFKRQWDVILRQIEQGTYERHVFKANLKGRSAPTSTAGPARPGPGAGASRDDLFAAYKDAAASCGQNVAGLTREKLDTVIKQQEAQLKKKLGVDKVAFKVVVQDGKVKLKAGRG
ncbi:MAG: MXAN_5187 C-terminal domain-containing protein [Myxococcota bacterium]